MKDFKSPKGDFAKVEGQMTDARKGGAPSVGFDNSSRGNLAEHGPGPGVPANGTRIR